MKRHDAIVIGAGLNGLVAAAKLARAGRDVLVLDRSPQPGGLHGTYEIAPGFHAPRYVHGSVTLPALLVQELDLARHGLRFLHMDGAISCFPDGSFHTASQNGIVLRRDMARFSPRDADSWTRYRRDMLRAASHMRVLLEGRPELSGRGLFSGLRTRLLRAGRLADMPRAELHNMVSLATLSIEEYLDRYFVSNVVKAHLAGAALMASTYGPVSPGSAWRLVVPWLAETGDATGGAPRVMVPVGGMAALTKALVSVICAHGGTLRMDAEVTDVLMRKQEVCGVALANGEKIASDVVFSGLDVKRSFLSLFEWKHLPDGLAARVARMRMKGVAAKLNIALAGMPSIPALPSTCLHSSMGLRLPGTLSDMENAFADWREGSPPRTPIIDVLIPTLHDASLAPHAGHILSAVIQFVPEKLHDGSWTNERREALKQLVLSRLAEVMPDIQDFIIASDLLLPSDIESEIGITNGDISYGEMSLDQMFFNRPFPVTGQERQQSLHNFYVCSPSIHPGALMTGMAGAQAVASYFSSFPKWKRQK